MSEFLDKLKQIQSFINALSLKKIFLLTLFLFVVGFAYATFENRDSVYNFFIKSAQIHKTISNKTVSKKTAAEIDLAVIKSDIIVAIQVTLVDFQRNTRIISYTSIDKPELRLIFGKFIKSAPSELPLFNTDVVNNRRLVDLVNGEFICDPYRETIAAKLVPESTTHITTLCANSIPPFYGRFSGIIGIYLHRQPTPGEVDQIRALAKSLSSTIFNNDLK
jgi:hypothetical protein